MKRVLLYILLICLYSTFAFGATYYIKQSSAGGDTGADCANAKSLTWFNSNAAANDTATLCDDTYTTPIYPGNTGQTYIADNECTGTPDNYVGAVFNGTSSYGALLQEADDNTTIDGICFQETGHNWIQIAGADGITIQNCKFYIASAFSGITVGYQTAGNNSYDTKILNNVFNDGEAVSSSSDMPSDMVRLDRAYRTLVEGNTFGNARHANVGTSIYQPEYVVIRNNIAKNEWHAALGNGGKFVLVEGNTVYDGSVGGNPYGTYKGAFAFSAYASDNQIIRNNIAYNGDTGMSGGSTSLRDSENIYFYNNTLYNHWKGAQLSNNGDASNEWANYNIKNNIFALNSPTKPNSLNITVCYYDATIDAGDAAVPFVSCANHSFQDDFYLTSDYSFNLWYGQTDYFYYPDTSSSQRSILTLDASSANYDAAWHDNETGDPLFTNAGNADFTLTSNSPAIDAGTFLTEASGAAAGGSSTALTVDDAGYFYDGWSIAGETADYIYIVGDGTPANVLVQISSINYGTNVITLASVQNWDDAADIYLAYSSTIGIMGDGVDIGANEYDLVISNMSPPNNGTDVAIGASITWTNPTGATSVTVFFDSTDGTAQVATGSLDTSYDPGGMTVSTEYFWKVNVVHAGGTEVGTVYSFTTASGPPTDPNKKATIGYDDGGGTIKYDSGGMTIQ